MQQSINNNKFDIIVFVGILIFSIIIHYGRIGASIDGVFLATDPAMYASIAAAFGQPNAFLNDFAYSIQSQYATHISAHVKLIHYIATNFTDNNYGLAYLQLTGIFLFIHYMAFYYFGIVLFIERYKALIFTILMGQLYRIPWGTYWGAGYLDYTPRYVFNALYGIYICIALYLLKRPRWWPLFMAATGVLVYVHSISALPVALGFWLGFLFSKPKDTSLSRHLGYMFFCGLCFLVTIIPYASLYLNAGIELSAENITFMQYILRTHLDIEYTEYWYGLGNFIKQYTFLPVFPLATVATWLVLKYGQEKEKIFVKQILYWILGTVIVIALFIVDQIIAELLDRQHLEFDLIRVCRFLPFFAICLIFLAFNVLLRLSLTAKRSYYLGARVLAIITIIGFMLGGQQDMVRTSLAWYWNSLDAQRYEAAYAPLLNRADMIEALKKYTQKGETIFYPERDQSIRYNALRPLVYVWKDFHLFYYSKSIAPLKTWNRITLELRKSPTAYIDIALTTNPDYILSNRPQDKAMLQELGSVVWENEGYVLIKNMNK